MAHIRKTSGIWLINYRKKLEHRTQGLAFLQQKTENGPCQFSVMKVIRMIINICNQARAMELAGSTSVPTSIISITSKDEANVVFPDNPNLISILPLKFNDLTEEFDEEGIPYGRPVPKQEDFEGLREFVNALSCKCLLIHCWEGRSRSAAVAKAVYEYRGRQDELRAETNACPNPLVYTFACRELSRR